MSPKTAIWIGIMVGSTAGSMLPSLWGAGIFSMWSIFFSTIGALLGIWCGFKITH